MFRRERGNRRDWTYNWPYKTPRVGQVVGLCVRYDGEIEWGSVEDPSFFVPDKRHLFWLVRFGMVNKPVCVYGGDMRLAEIGEVADLPYVFPRRVVSEREKECLSADSACWPRDVMGRWTSGPVVHC